MPRSDSTHVVQFYEDDQTLTSTVATFLATGLATGQAAVVIATPDHRQQCLSRLNALGIAVGQVSEQGRLKVLDARETLETFMVGSMPDERRFQDTVGGAIASSLILGRGRPPVRAYGEMVDLLWEDDNAPAAIRLEELWNDLADRHAFSLLCAYSVNRFRNGSDPAGLERICRLHDHVMPEGRQGLAVGQVHQAHVEGKLRDALVERRLAAEDLRDFVENALEGLHAIGPDGIILWANQAELDLLGYSRAEYVGHHIADFHVDSHVIGDMLARLARGEVLRNCAARLRCANGAIKDVLINANGLWEDGQFVRSRCFTRDITQQREAAEATERLGAIVQSSDDAIVSKNLRSIVTSWNGAAERIFGYTAAEMIGRSIHQIIPAERRSEEDVVLDRIRRGEAVDHFETMRRRKDGTEVAISLTVSPIRDASGVVVGASKIARDITERKRHEADRDRLLARAELARADAVRANRVKDEFLATLSHELRSPLNAIAGWAQLAKREMDEVKSPTIRRALDVIERNVAMQLRLINDLLDVSSITTGKLALRADVVDMTTVVSAVVDNMSPEAFAKGIHVEHSRALEPLLVVGDAARLEQVVWNLLSNALKFTPRDGRITITVAQHGDSARVVVQDSGEGITPEFLAHVFDRFRQGDATTTRRHGGLGLGLAVVKHLVEAHGGRITAASEGRGLGARFTVDIPAAVDAELETPGHPVRRLVPLQDARLLVLDDDADARGLLHAILRRHKAAVTTAGSMGEALEVLHGEHSYDLVLSDLAMPGHDGYEFIRAVRADARPDVRRIGAIAVTAHADPTYRARALAAGFDDYVTKPIDTDRLVSILQRMLQWRAAQ